MTLALVHPETNWADEMADKVLRFVMDMNTSDAEAREFIAVHLRIAESLGRSAGLKEAGRILRGEPVKEFEGDWNV